MELTIEVPTAKAGMNELRPLLDAALQKEFPGGMLQRKWNGDVLELSGPGARGTIAYQEGLLVGRATLGPPASLMRPLIESKVAAALKAVA
jgi:hypothetical protein